MTSDDFCIFLQGGEMPTRTSGRIWNVMKEIFPEADICTRVDRVPASILRGLDPSVGMKTQG